MNYYEEKEITFTDVIKKGDFWGWLVMGTMFGGLALTIAWSIFRLISGNDPDVNLIDKDTGNFIVFLAFIIATFKSYNSVYDTLYKERQQRIKETKEWSD